MYWRKKTTTKTLIRVSTTQVLKLQVNLSATIRQTAGEKKNPKSKLKFIPPVQVTDLFSGLRHFHTECHSLKLFGNRKEDVRIQRNRDSEMMTVPAQMMSLFLRTPKLTVRYHKLCSHIKKCKTTWSCQRLRQPRKITFIQPS